MLGWISHAFTLAVLTYASLNDLKSREVSNALWAFAYPVGLAISAFNVAFGRLTVETFFVSVGVSAAFGLIFAVLGLFGGADMKAMIFIGLAVPAYPAEPLLGDPLMLPALAVLMNSALFSLACPIAVFALNVAELARGKRLFEGVEAGLAEKLALMFTVRRVGVEKLGLTYFPAEKVVEKDGRVVREPRHFVHAEAELEPMLETFRTNKDIFSEGVLASPTIPFIVFFTLAVATVPVGNVFLSIIQNFLGLPR